MRINLEDVKIEPSWKEALKEEFLSENFARVKENFLRAKAAGEVYPPNALIFNAFNLTPFNAVKVVILGQDPYHGAGQAMGLSFSVPRGVRVPPSLANIYKEIFDDLGIKEPNCGDLTYWAKQGALLLNATLSVSESKSAANRRVAPSRTNRRAPKPAGARGVFRLQAFLPRERISRKPRRNADRLGFK